MSLTPATFRQQFPEFCNTGLYPDAAVSMWITTAGLLLNADRWSELIDIGTGLFVAHNLTVSARDQVAAQSGAIPGQASGIMASKAVDKVSASYDTAAIQLDNGGYYNSTSYGIRLLQMARWVGAGGVQIGAC